MITHVKTAESVVVLKNSDVIVSTVNHFILDLV